MPLIDRIKQILEAEFDIPFSVRENSSHAEPYITVAPQGNEFRLFDIVIEFKNQIRMEMLFEPQKYGAQMVYQMGLANSEQKSIFCSYAKQLSCNGSKIVMRVNDIPQNPSNFENWPKEWKKVQLKVDIRPIEFKFDDQPDYFQTVSKWLPLMMGLSLSLLNVVKITDDESGKIEGKKYNITANRYERNPINRVLCIAHYGYTCQICGFNFEEKYGDVGKNFIHVHHIIPVSQMGEGYCVDPVKDLIPVCPNCHAMLHKQDPPIMPEKLREMIFEAKSKKSVPYKT